MQRKAYSEFISIISFFIFDIVWLNRRFEQLHREVFSWKLLLAALVLVVVGVLLMFQSSNMLFLMNPLAIVFMILAVFFIFSGIILILLGLAAMASV